MIVRLPFLGNYRGDIVKAATWILHHRNETIYTEGPDRLYSLSRPYETPFKSDCSSGIECCYRWAGAPDPSGNDYQGDPYTGTLVEHGKLIPARRSKAADVVIFGPNTGWHAALVLRGGTDPLCWSMGEQGDPHILRVSVIEQGVSYVNNVASCQVRYFRYNTARR